LAEWARSSERRSRMRFARLPPCRTIHIASSFTHQHTREFLLFVKYRTYKGGWIGRQYKNTK
jgi:hypothetical protein